MCRHVKSVVILLNMSRTPADVKRMHRSVRTINRWLLGTLLSGLIVALLVVWIHFRQVSEQLFWAANCTRDIVEGPAEKTVTHEAFTKVTQSLQNTRQEIRQVEMFLTTLGVLGIGLLVTAILYFRCRVAIPTERLRNGIHKIIEGDLDHRLVVEGELEFRDLAQSFNYMAEQLLKNTNRLYCTNSDLIQTNQYLEKHRRNLEESNQQLQAEVITRKKAEQTLEATVEHLRIANRDLEEFAAVAAHDLKTPIRGIGTLADLFKQDYQDCLDERGLELLDMLGQRTQRIHGLVGGILKYTHMTQSGTISLRQVKTAEVVKQVIEQVMPPESIEVWIEGGLPDVVCDEFQLYQVFQNLIANAVSYMDKPKGQVRIHGEVVNGFWVFSVADNGPGIPPKQQEKIFKIFHTLESKDDCQTTGIGLSLVRKIVERYGGRAWVESEPGIGSTFFFSLKQFSLAPGQEELHHFVVDRRRNDRRRS